MISRRFIPHGIALAVALAAFACPAVAADVETGRRAYQAGDYFVALENWLPLAEEGDPDAAFGMGMLYERGYGLGRSAPEAASWYRRAAVAGHAGAAYNLGNLYRKGDGVPRDTAEAVRWWRKAADGGLPQAQINLGVAYQKGDGVAKDEAAAFAWYARAAEGGDPAGMFYFGVAHENGVGTPPDLAAAVGWYRKAAEAGEARAAERLAGLGLAVAEAEGAAAGEAASAVFEPASSQPATSQVAQQDAAAPAASEAPQDAATEPEPASTTVEEAAVAPGAYVQIAAYLSARRAERAFGELAAAQPDLVSGLLHRLVRMNSDQGTLYRLQLGPLPSDGEAEALCAAFIARAIDCFVVKR